jgi:hypothetical protein
MNDTPLTAKEYLSQAYRIDQPHHREGWNTVGADGAALSKKEHVFLTRRAVVPHPECDSQLEDSSSG